MVTEATGMVIAKQQEKSQQPIIVDLQSNLSDQSGQSEKRTHSLQRTKVQSRIEKPIHIIHWQPPRTDHLY